MIESVSLSDIKVVLPCGNVVPFFTLTFKEMRENACQLVNLSDKQKVVLNWWITDIFGPLKNFPEGVKSKMINSKEPVVHLDRTSDF